MDEFSLKGKAALVIGANGGLGKAITLAIANAGAEVAVAGRNMTIINQIRDELTSNNTNSISLNIDMTALDTIKKGIHDVVNWKNKIDILFNCTGINMRKPSFEFTEEDWDVVIDTNLKGSYFASIYAASQMSKNNEGGKIVNFSSIAEAISYPKSSVYGISKAGISELTRKLAYEFADLNIQVNAIAPGLFKTEQTKPTFEDPVRLESFLKAIPAKKYGEPEYLTGLAVFLCSSASNYLTGQVIFIDGGWSLV